MKNIDMTELPIEAMEYIVQLRKEAFRYRAQRNGARAELEALRDRLWQWRSSTGETFGQGSYNGVERDARLLGAHR